MRMLCRRLSKLAWLPPALALAAMLGAAPAQAVEGCANEALRKQDHSLSLPDCRAYEMVSPADKAQGEVNLGGEAVAPDGEAITWGSFASFAGNPSNPAESQYVSVRTPSGWQTQGASPPKANAYYTDVRSLSLGASADLSRITFMTVTESGAYNLQMRNPVGGFEPITDIAELPPTPGSFPSAPTLYDATPDYAHVIVQSSQPLLPGAPEGALYEWNEGELKVVSVLPGGTASPGFQGMNVFPWGNNAVSDNGSRVFWTPVEFPTEETLYLYEGGSSKLVTDPQCTTAGHCATGAGVGTFWDASSDGGVALLTSAQELTNDANTGTEDQGRDLYRYEASTGALSDLTPDAADPNGAEVQGVVGASEDASVAYFVAEGILTSGPNAEGREPQAGGDNLYVSQGGKTQFIATLAGADAQDWVQNSPTTRSTLVQVTPSGQHLLFTTTAQLKSGYENGGHSEVYVYDAASAHLSCVSCNPAGTPASANAAPARSEWESGNSFAIMSRYRNISSNGKRVFFESGEELLPQDVNAAADVYEWEQEGEGGCPAGSSAGCLYLISSGRSGLPSKFMGASENGNDVFFRTGQQLVGQDTDENVDLYDARVGGGFPAPTASGAPCESEEACAGAIQSPAQFDPAGSELVDGIGNIASTVPGKVSKPKQKPLTPAQKLRRALKRCGRESKRKRLACRHTAIRRYGRNASVRRKHKHSSKRSGR